VPEGDICCFLQIGCSSLFSHVRGEGGWCRASQSSLATMSEAKESRARKAELEKAVAAAMSVATGFRAAQATMEAIDAAMPDA
jgi:hypothetical protein